MEQQEQSNIHQGKKKKNNDDGNQNQDRDYKEFLNEIEEDPEMRQNINLFKVSLDSAKNFIGRRSTWGIGEVACFINSR